MKCTYAYNYMYAVNTRSLYNIFLVNKRKHTIWFLFILIKIHLMRIQKKKLKRIHNYLCPSIIKTFFSTFRFDNTKDFHLFLHKKKIVAFMPCVCTKYELMKWNEEALIISYFEYHNISFCKFLKDGSIAQFKTQE